MNMAVAITTHHSNNILLCDTGFNFSWSWCTRRCEVICIGDRDDADQIRVIQVDENPNAW